MMTMMNAQLHMAAIALETGLSSVRSDYQYGWNLDADNKPECGTPVEFTAILRKSHTRSSGSAYNRLQRSA
jgi:hypothetical protein